MVVTFERAVEVYEHALRGPLDSAISPRQVVNEVGAFLYGIHTWKFLERPPAFLNLRGQITGTAGTTVSAVFTEVGAFADYTFLDGDRLEIVDGGAGAELGQYPVASHTDDDDIVLASSPGNSAGDIEWRLHTDGVALPVDFGEILAYEANNSLENSLTLTTFQQLLDLRTNQVDVGGFAYYGALVHARPNAGGHPVPRLEIYPPPLTNENAAVRIFYRAGWRDVDEDIGFLDIPRWFEGLFFFTLREWAQGYEGKGDDAGGLFDRTDRILASRVAEAAMRMDARMQPDYGCQAGGNVSMFQRRDTTFLTFPSRFTVEEPS